MPDNVGYTPGSGATVAADDIGGVLYQRVKPVVGADGSAVDVSSTNPMPVEGEGELMETLQQIRDYLAGLMGSIGKIYPGINGDIRVSVAPTVGSLSTSVSGSLTTVTTVTTVSDITSVSGWNYQRPYEGMILPTLQMTADTLLSNIVVS